jgi:peptidoglycan/xylan/chitin deacetylase (PgdA/CDA1 family)/CelD/BcsL family acetyltransferase involved in cellulose biosynthesis
MKVVELRTEAEFERLRGDWDRLVCASASRSIFVTWEWMQAWWSAYGAPGQLRILTAFDETGELRGIAPLWSLTLRQYGQSVPALALVGDGLLGSVNNDSDYLDLILAPGYERQVMEAFHRHWEHAFADGTVLLLNEVPETSPALAVLKEMADSRGMHWASQRVPCASVTLPGTWEDYLRALQPRFRTKIRSVLRNVESRSEIRFGFCAGMEEAQRLLPALFDLHTRRWARETKPGVFGEEKKRAFYERLSRHLLERQWLRFSYLEWNGQVLACQYGFVYGKTYSQLQEGYEPASEHWNLGVALRAWSIREFLKEGITEYDFLGGINRHKTDWGGEAKYSQRVVLAAKTYRNALFRRGPELAAATRESLAKLLPEKVLETRRKLLTGSRAGGGEWMRRVVADCYFHSGMPALSRGLRQRYEVTVNGGGKFSLRPRKEPSARIFYYHRVNDDNDPFFDAISPRVFEGHMRYLAKHYKVGSLSEIMRHLEDGSSAGTMVGITFDDGYRDNFENAFPILRRYGLPATIFLTTGSIDSGEPLWFERLAEAVKKTSKESIDLEIDIPRRIWMRTPEERLAASREIFLVLRLLDDTERNRRVGEILKQLAAPEETDRRNKMLTWDQVRTMKAAGIDFGGHTVTHPFLSKLAAGDAVREVSECKRRIEEETQAPVHYFAYPNGREEDFAPANSELLRAAGYRAAVTTIWGMNYRSTDPMQLRRGGPWESDRALFAYKLDWYQLANQ